MDHYSLVPRLRFYSILPDDQFVDVVLANLIIPDILEYSLFLLLSGGDGLILKIFLFYRISDILYRRYIRAFRGVEDIADTMITLKDYWPI